jgi:acetyl-CoA synthetase
MLEALLKEKRTFKPSKKLSENSNVRKWMKEKGISSLKELLKKAEDTEWFWDDAAMEMEWFKPYKKVLEWKPPFAKWFVGGKCNIAYNAVDRHIESGKGKKLAFIWEGEPGDTRKLTYRELGKEVNRFANALKSIGVRKGDRVSIYLPMIPELPIAMLACAKIGAVHSVVFSGFSAKAFEGRVNDCKAKVAVTVDGFYRKGKRIALKPNADHALKKTPSVKKVIVVKRTGERISMKKGRDVWWHELIKGQPEECETEIMESEDALFILYTSGSTGKPKGVVHVHGGYSVGTSRTLKWVFDLKDSDVWWCAADIGWITGHSYIVYAPLILGATSVMYEGHPLHPKPDRLWKMIEKYRVTAFYTAPTTIRMFMKLGEKWPRKHNLNSLRILGSVGEPINPEAWVWYYTNIGKERCPIMDTWWQTETGMFLITPLPITELKPGSATNPFPGIKADVYSDEGRPVRGKGGHLVIKAPWPAMLKTLYKDPKKYKKQYWETFKNIYKSGDVARIDKNGYFWLQGREDDILNVAGHRIGTAEVESALVSHSAVAEAAVVGIPDPQGIRGDVVMALIILKKGKKPSDRLRKELISHVGREIGPIARPAKLQFVKSLPETRSGKIMRRVIKAEVRGEPVGDISTLRNPEAVKELERVL